MPSGEGRHAFAAMSGTGERSRRGGLAPRSGRARCAVEEGEQRGQGRRAVPSRKASGAVRDGKLGRRHGFDLGLGRREGGATAIRV